MSTPSELIAEAEKLLEQAKVTPVTNAPVTPAPAVTREEFDTLLARIAAFNARTGQSL
jgi:hypothetical protein